MDPNDEIRQAVAKKVSKTVARTVAKTVAKTVATAVALFIGFIVFIALGGLVVWWLWNWLMPELFGMPQLTFWQALGLLALSRILFGGFGRSGHNGMHARKRRRESEWWKRRADVCAQPSAHDSVREESSSSQEQTR